MAESNTENSVEIRCAKATETPKHTLLNRSVIYTEYHNEELLYPNDVIEKWKIELEVIRFRNDVKIKKNQLPITTPVNDEPKHEIFENIKNKDSFSVLPCGEDVADKKSSEVYQMKPRENRVKNSHYVMKNIQKSKRSNKKSLIAKKPKQMTSTIKRRSH